MTREMLDPKPFAGWLEWVMARDDVPLVQLEARYGIRERTMREIMKGRTRGVELSTVERALIADDTTTLFELYPALYEAEAAQR